jgi:hypothetical protein
VSRLEEELNKNAVCHHPEALEGLGDFRVEGQIIRTVRYAMTLCYWLRKKQYYRA